MAYDPVNISLGQLAIQRGLMRQDQAKACLDEATRMSCSILKVAYAQALLDTGQCKALEQFIDQQRPDDSQLEASQVSNSSVSAGSVQVGQVLGGYSIQKLLGQGGMGAVFVARKHNVDYALKVILNATGLTDELRFEREAQAAAAVDKHPNIVSVHAFGREQSMAYMILDLVDGQGLDTLIEKGQPWDIDEALGLIHKIGGALAHIHQHGIIHRDLKPANILIRRSDNEPLLTDFGLAKVSQAETLTKTGEVLGTPQYMAPEQLEGQPVTASADVWALGVILFELTTGQRPVAGQTLMEICSKILKGKIPEPSSILEGYPEDLARVVMGALQREPADRYASVSEFLEALRQFQAGQRVRDLRPSLFKRWLRQYFWVLVAVIAVTLCLLAARLYQQRRESQTVRENLERSVGAELRGLLIADIKELLIRDFLARQSIDWTVKPRKNWKTYAKTLREYQQSQPEFMAKSADLSRFWRLLRVYANLSGWPRSSFVGEMNPISRQFLKLCAQVKTGSVIQQLAELEGTADQDLRELLVLLRAFYGLREGSAAQASVLEQLSVRDQCLALFDSTLRYFLFDSEAKAGELRARAQCLSGSLDGLDDDQRLKIESMFRGQFQARLPAWCQRQRSTKLGLMASLSELDRRLKASRWAALSRVLGKSQQSYRDYLLAWRTLPATELTRKFLNFQGGGFFLPSTENMKLAPKYKRDCLMALSMFAKVRTSDPRAPLPSDIPEILDSLLTLDIVTLRNRNEEFKKLATLAFRLDCYTREMKRIILEYVNSEFIDDPNLKFLNTFWKSRVLDHAAGSNFRLPSQHIQDNFQSMLKLKRACVKLAERQVLGVNYQRLLEYDIFRHRLAERTYRAVLKDRHGLKEFEYPPLVEAQSEAVPHFKRFLELDLADRVRINFEILFKLSYSYVRGRAAQPSRQAVVFFGLDPKASTGELIDKIFGEQLKWSHSEIQRSKQYLELKYQAFPRLDEEAMQSHELMIASGVRLALGLRELARGERLAKQFGQREAVVRLDYRPDKNYQYLDQTALTRVIVEELLTLGQYSKALHSLGPVKKRDPTSTEGVNYWPSFIAASLFTGRVDEAVRSLSTLRNWQYKDSTEAQKRQFLAMTMRCIEHQLARLLIDPYVVLKRAAPELRAVAKSGPIDIFNVEARLRYILVPGDGSGDARGLLRRLQIEQSMEKFWKTLFEYFMNKANVRSLPNHSVLKLGLVPKELWRTTGRKQLQQNCLSWLYERNDVFRGDQLFQYCVKMNKGVAPIWAYNSHFYSLTMRGDIDQCYEILLRDLKIRPETCLNTRLFGALTDQSSRQHRLDLLERIHKDFSKIFKTRRHIGDRSREQVMTVLKFAFPKTGMYRLRDGQVKEAQEALKVSLRIFGPKIMSQEREFQLLQEGLKRPPIYVDKHRSAVWQHLAARLNSLKNKVEIQSQRLDRLTASMIGLGAAEAEFFTSELASELEELKSHEQTLKNYQEISQADLNWIKSRANFGLKRIQGLFQQQGQLANLCQKQISQVKRRLDMLKDWYKQ